MLGLVLAISLLVVTTPNTSRITTAQTNEPHPREPILRIETGTHTGAIGGIAVDASNRILVTASEDKTLRVWDLPSGRLVRTIRVPIGFDNEGRLYAAAISPDGRTIASGGWITDTSGQNSIYIFDRESGRLVRRLSGFPNIIVGLIYSSDGRYLAALGSKNGIRVFTTTTYAVVMEDKDYQGDSYGAEFDRNGRLLTAAGDGFVRLYQADGSGAFRLVKKKLLLEKHDSYRLSISPDGSRVAVGSASSSKVVVLRLSDLELLFMPDTTGVSRGVLGTTGWSADGQFLYAGGTWCEGDDECRIRVWANAGRGAYVDVTAGRSSIQQIVSLREGGIVYGVSDGSFGIINADHKRQLLVTSMMTDYGDSRTGLLLPDNLMGVGFNYYAQKVPAHFSLVDRRLNLVSAANLNWRPAQTENQQLKVTEWYNSTSPKVNGKPIKLEAEELSRALAIAPDARTFVLGTEYSLRLFDANGTERWTKDPPAITWSVNISADGKVVVAAYNDGTIRWYRMSDGKELLAFFPHADRKRWVLWTPSGYYDASPGAEELIGWHVNNGTDQLPDFFPVAQFRSIYYRPDVVSKVITLGDEQLALKQANEEAGRSQQQTNIALLLPPVVEIVSPREGTEVSTTDITVQFRVRTPSGEPVTGYKVLVDGRPTLTRQLSREESVGDTRQLRLTVPERDSEITVIAENRFTSSVPATLRLKWRAPIAERPAPFVIKPKLYIFAVGVSRYANPKYNLKLAHKDAGDFVNAMLAQKHLLYRDVEVKLLRNEEATKDEILDGLDWIRKETTSNDMAMVFFAGHGVNDQNNYYYFCPHNVDPDRLLRTGVTFSDIKNTVSAIAGKALFFVDTCHSGNSIGLSARRNTNDINIIINELASAENGVVVFSAATGSESSLEREEWNNGAFTKALVEGLSGAAAIGSSGRITYNMLNVYISERVKELTKGQQHPTMISPQTIPDFPIAVKR